MSETLIADLEANGLRPDVSRVWQLNVINVDTGKGEGYNDHGPGPSLAEGYERLLAAERTIWHNGIDYDLWVLAECADVHLDWRKTWDTLVLSRLGNPERLGGHALESWGEEVGVAKQQHDEWHRWSPGMAERCASDCHITLLVWRRLKAMLTVMPVAVAIEHGTAYFVARTRARGFRLDVPRTQALARDLLATQERMGRELRELFPPILVPKPSLNKCLKELKNLPNRAHWAHGLVDRVDLDDGSGVRPAPYCEVQIQEFNPGSRQQIANRLIHKYGWKPTAFTPSGAPEITENSLHNLPYPEAQAMIAYLTVEKKLSQIMSQPKADGSGGGWLHHVRDDGRVYANLNACRTVTGRPACSSPNIQQVDTDKKMRACWIPEIGWVLVGCDAEGLELRCLAHYLGRYDGGAYADMLIKGNKSDGTDVHSVAQRLICFNHRDPFTKNAEYGWLYGAGDYKLGMIAFEDANAARCEIDYSGLGLDKPPGRKPSLTMVGRAMRSRLVEGIDGLGKLVDQVRLQAKRDGYLRGIDGRKLRVRSLHSALNLLLQSAGAIVMKQAMSLFVDRYQDAGLVWDGDFASVMWVHDELQFEARPDRADRLGRLAADCIRDAGIELNFRCPLAGDSHAGASWAETH